MRPAGEVRQALFRAACSLATPQNRPTLQEMAHAACVGIEVATHTVKNMTRAGDLVVDGERRVPYRNRPVAEYRPVLRDEEAAAPAGYVDLGMALAGWAR